MKKIFLCFQLLFALFSCSQKEESSSTYTKEFLNNEKLIYKLIDNANNKGDTLAYNELFYYYSDDSRDEELLYSSMLMAYKYNYPKAYYDISFIFSRLSKGEVYKDIDDKTKKLILYYLALSYEKGYTDAEGRFKMFLGENAKIEKSIFYFNEFTRLDSISNLKNP